MMGAHDAPIKKASSNELANGRIVTRSGDCCALAARAG